MPSSAAILNAAAAISNEWRALAIAWHMTAAVILIATCWRRPGRRTVAMLVIAPVFSVSMLAWWSGNPFTGTLLAGVALLMAVIARRLEPATIAAGPTPDVAAGVSLAIFGLVYPHFLRAESWVEFLYAAPFGLLPCPTLAAVAGVSLMLGSFGSRAWATTVAVASLTYGVIGVAILGVWIDALLIAGGLMLLRTTLPARVRTRPSAIHGGAGSVPSAPDSAPA